MVFNKVRRLNADGTAPADALLARTRLTVPKDAVEVRVERFEDHGPVRSQQDISAMP
ncbi:hypothetical protein [Paraburkholderia lacunae]|uniref:hypothetical protein n=1 Tax=Paraburkholderia lacunae TaxID=2211104 RepID=UPI001FCB0BEE|nr:hypothetical protein [Paraburkholderia lacunae]